MSQKLGVKTERKWFCVNGERVHALSVSNGLSKNRPPLVLVSGLGVSSTYMKPALLELAEFSDVYCPDLPGFGESSKPERVLDISELSESLAAFMRESEIEGAVLIGHSFGCQIAGEFALRYPEKLERLVLAAPSGDPSINSAFRYFGRLILDVPREPLSLIPIAVNDYLKAGLIRGWRTLQYALQDCLEEKLPHIETPTLVVRGSKDPIVSAEWTDKMAELLPQGHLISIEGAAHAVNYNSPVKFARAIQEFLFQSDSNESRLDL